MLRVFISYSHYDDRFRDELDSHLSALRREGLIEVWYDQEMLGGDELDATIHEQLETADIIVLLVSARFIKSHYCYDVETTRAMDRHRSGTARVIPVIVDPCSWQSLPLATLKVLPHDGKAVSQFSNQNEAYVQIVAEIRRAATLSPRSQAGPRSPEASQGATLPSDTPPTRSSPRIRKSFSDRDRDLFGEEALGYIAAHFEASLAALERADADIETRFRRRDDATFTAAVYVQGTLRAECKIWYAPRGSLGGLGIAYSDDPSSTNRFNEQLFIEDDGYTIHLRLLGMTSVGATPGPMTKEQAAAYYWDLLLRRLN